jgi:hypothetical protein
MEEAAQRPSPLTATTVTLGGQAGKLCYGSPSANNRTVMGELVPFGEPWRMGANEATALHLPFPAVVGDIHLAPGSYSLYAVPRAAGVGDRGESKRRALGGSHQSRSPGGRCMGSFTVPAQSLDDMVERLTFRWEATDEGSGSW